MDGATLIPNTKFFPYKNKPQDYFVDLMKSFFKERKNFVNSGLIHISDSTRFVTIFQNTTNMLQLYNEITDKIKLNELPEDGIFLGLLKQQYLHRDENGDPDFIYGIFFFEEDKIYYNQAIAGLEFSEFKIKKMMENNWIMFKVDDYTKVNLNGEGEIF